MEDSTGRGTTICIWPEWPDGKLLPIETGTNWLPDHIEQAKKHAGQAHLYPHRTEPSDACPGFPGFSHLGERVLVAWQMRHHENRASQTRSTGTTVSLHGWWWLISTGDPGKAKRRRGRWSLIE